MENKQATTPAVLTLGSEVTGFESHPSFTLPRIPAGRYVTVNYSSSQYPPDYYRGLFETSGCEDMGSEMEIYILRRVAPHGTAPEFVKVWRRWQEHGGISVFDMKLDPKFNPKKRHD